MSARYDGRPEQYRDAYLACRGIAHTWAHPDGHWEISAKGARVTEYRRTLVCRVCTCERVDTFDADMRPVRTTRRYPDDYLTARENRIDGATARLEQVRRVGLRPGARLRAVGS